jgi:predicted DNA-binding transcriptional regulator AlpA
MMTTKTATPPVAYNNTADPERRRQIWEARQQGRTCADIGLEFGIGAQRVSDLAAKHERILRQQQRHALKTTAAAPPSITPTPTQLKPKPKPKSVKSAPTPVVPTRNERKRTPHRQHRGALKTATTAPPPAPTQPTALSRTLLSLDDLHDLGISYSRWQLSRLVRDGQFPAPVALGPNRKAWRADDIKAWLAARPTVVT